MQSTAAKDIAVSFVVRRNATDEASYPVQVEGLSKTYRGGVEAVRGISFEIGEGEVYGLLGPNGAGKSTTIGMLTGSVRPSAGSAFIGGYDVRRHPQEARRQAGVVFQDSVLDGQFSGRKNLELHARLWRMERKDAGQRIQRLVAMMDLRGRLEDKVITYSGGMKRRLELARGLLARPRVLFLDEPTVGLDPAVREEIWGLIDRSCREEGVTVLLTTHYLEEAERLCDRVGIVFQGRLVAQGSPAELLSEYGSEIVEVRVQGDPARAIQALKGLWPSGAVHNIGSTFTFRGEGEDGLPGVTNVLKQAGIGIIAAAARRPTLNDVFNRLTGAGLEE